MQERANECAIDPGFWHKLLHSLVFSEANDSIATRGENDGEEKSEAEGGEHELPFLLLKIPQQENSWKCRVEKLSKFRTQSHRRRPKSRIVSGCDDVKVTMHREIFWLYNSPTNVGKDINLMLLPSWELYIRSELLLLLQGRRLQALMSSLAPHQQQLL